MEHISLIAVPQSVQMNADDHYYYRVCLFRASMADGPKLLPKPQKDNKIEKGKWELLSQCLCLGYMMTSFDISALNPKFYLQVWKVCSLFLNPRITQFIREGKCWILNSLTVLELLICEIFLVPYNSQSLWYFHRGEGLHIAMNNWLIVSKKLDRGKNIPRKCLGFRRLRLWNVDSV